MNIDAATAAHIVEQLRYGLPPHGYSRVFTVGRQEQIQALAQQLDCSAGTGLLLQADYGAGKSHLLQVIRELALEAGFAVSLVVVNAQEGVRFDRLETVFGAVCRRLEVDTSGNTGIAALFERVGGPHPRPLSGSERGDEGEDSTVRFRVAPSPHRRGGLGVRFPPALSSNGRWDYSEYLEAPAMYVALRAWLFGDAATRLLVADWLTNPAAYRERRRYLYDTLVYGLRDRFADPRPEWKFHSQELLVLQRLEHSQVWPALGDLARIARVGGRRGLVLLFDEMEDIVHNLPRTAQRQDAIHNLLPFFHRPASAIHAFFAVTPDFIEQCRPYLPLIAPTEGAPVRLPALLVEAVRREELLELARKIRHVHALAYQWDALHAMPDDELAVRVAQLGQTAAPQRVRYCIQGVVQVLDEQLASTTS